MNDGRERLFRTLPNEPISVKKEMDGDEEAAAGGALLTHPQPDQQHRDRTSSAPVSSRSDNSPAVHLREQEEALSALVAFRSKEVERLRQRLEYYKTQVEEAERKLRDSQSKLAGIRSQHDASSSSTVRTLKEEMGAAKPAAVNGTVTVKEEKIEEQRRPLPYVASTRDRQQPQQPESRPPLIIPAVRPKPVPPSSTDAKMMGRSARLELKTSMAPAGCSGMRASPSRFSQPGETFNSLKRSASSMPSPDRCKEIKNFRMKTVQKEHQDLVSCVRRSTSPCLIRFKPGAHICSQHKRKLRCLEINPVNDQLFVTSALDGVVNLWQLQSRGSGASLLSTTDCLSLKQRRWPEDIAWHPDGNSLFAVYTADGGDAQISILNLNSASKRVSLLQEKPHIKGIINSIQFMPSADLCFVTGGSDHAVILWNEGDNVTEWKPRAVHRNLHSSAVMGVAGLQQRKVVLSVGVDKRIIGFDLLANRADFKHQTETKCLSVLPNPYDFNLFMVQSGTPEKQLRLFDIRSRQTEIHSFGWKQESSESQSALINQAWSPDGLYLTSGSADPMFHIFDIRVNSRDPSQSVQAHQKRVFKAAWHQSLPLLISISSDLNVGIHMTK